VHDHFPRFVAYLRNGCWFHIHFNFLQSTGAFIAVSRYASATPLPPSVLSRGVGWQVNPVYELKTIPPPNLFASHYLLSK